MSERLPIEAKSINEINADLFQAEEVDRFAEPKDARKKAMDYLARREHGFDELSTKLVTAGFSSVVAADAVSLLRDEGLQSDRRFAESFVQSRVNQGKGPVRIRQELKERGIHAEVVSDTIDAAEADWDELAVDVRLKKFGDNLPTTFREKARQMRFLQYRGFEQDQIQSAMQSR